MCLFSPSPRKHYLNIIPNNLLRIYSPHRSNSSEENVHCVPVSNKTADDIVKVCLNCVEMLERPKQISGDFANNQSHRTISLDNNVRPPASRSDYSATGSKYIKSDNITANVRMASSSSSSKFSEEGMNLSSSLVSVSVNKQFEDLSNGEC